MKDAFKIQNDFTIALTNLIKEQSHISEQEAERFASLVWENKKILRVWLNTFFEEVYS